VSIWATSGQVRRSFLAPLICSGENLEGERPA
jgi:hypothetical protein